MFNRVTKRDYTKIRLPQLHDYTLKPVERQLVRMTNNGILTVRKKKNNNMKKIIVSLIVVLVTMTSFAQTQTSANPIVSPDKDIVYRLFPTQNMWTYIKLNTRNGQMWQVQYDTKDNQKEVPLSLITLVPSEKETNGRFFLYPTQNMYNFILLDQTDGRVWQVQWSIKAKDRKVIPIE